MEQLGKRVRPQVQGALGTDDGQPDLVAGQAACLGWYPCLPGVGEPEALDRCAAHAATLTSSPAT